MKNFMTFSFPNRSANESLARVTVAAFAAQLDPTVQEISEIKTVISEAVTNCIVHAYGDREGLISVKLQILHDAVLRITVRDRGIGIRDITQAMEPCFTTGSEDRAGMGFTIMQTFCDKFRVRSKAEKGTVVIMEKQIGKRDET